MNIDIHFLLMNKTQVSALLKKHFGYDSFRPLQEEIISHIIDGGDALVLMPTGGGKSLCFQLPALYFDGLTIIISPLISLMKDQVDALVANGIASAFINSSLDPHEIERVMFRSRNRELKMLYLAPERLASTQFKDFIQTLNVSFIAIDEAHCISEWGHDFRPEYRNLKFFREYFPNIPLVALTATATRRVRTDIIEQLQLKEKKVFLASFNRPNLSYSVYPKNDSFMQLMSLLQKYRNQPVIIYCFSRKNTEMLAKKLSDEGFFALPYHAGIGADIRKNTQEKFIRDQVPIIVATIAFGMGIDKPDVRLVVHYHLPKSIEGYYQETGRAGRDGLPSECALLYSYGDTKKHAYFINDINDEEERNQAFSKLQQVTDYCELHSCRRKFLLEYFGEDNHNEKCDNCDRCITDEEMFDATEITQKILSAVLRTGQRFGTNYIIDILRGSQSAAVTSRGHNALSVFGIVKDYDKLGLRSLIQTLVSKKILQKTVGEYPTIALTQEGTNFIKEENRIFLPKPAKSIKYLKEIIVKEKGYDIDLFEILRALRKEIANEKNVPPFIIFGDVSLREMASYYPQSFENFSFISGVGEKKLEQFGLIFLNTIREFAKIHNKIDITPRKIKKQMTSSLSHSPQMNSTYQETEKLLIQKLSIPQIANKRELSQSTIVSHIEKIFEINKNIDIEYLRPTNERFSAIKKAFLEADSDKLSPISQILGEKYSYNEIRIVRLLLKK